MDDYQLCTAIGRRWFRGAVLKGGHVLAVAGLLPLIVLGSLGSENIVLHAHHEWTLHFHKNITYGDLPGDCKTANAADHHGHGAGGAESHGGISLILSLSHVPRPSAAFSVQGFVQRVTFRGIAHRTISPIASKAAYSTISATTGFGEPLRARDTLTNLLLGSNSLLI